MIPFLIIFLLLVCFSWIELYTGSKKMGVPAIFTFLILFFFAGLRPEGIDKDYSNYAISFSRFGTPYDYIKYFDYWIFFEPLHYLIPSFVKTYLAPKNYVLISMLIFAFAGVGLKLYGIKKLTPLFFQATVIYFSYFYMLHEMTQVRAGIAAGIFLICIPLTVQSKNRTVILLILCSTLLHYSSLIFFALFLINNNSINKKIYLPVMAATLLLAFVDTSFVLRFLSFDLGPITFKSLDYLERTELGEFEGLNKLNFVFIFTYVSTLISLVFSHRIELFNPYVNILLKLQIIGLFLFQLLSAIPSLAFRISDLFFTVQVVLFTYFSYIFKNRFVGFGIAILTAIGFLILNLVHLKLIKGYL